MLKFKIFLCSFLIFFHYNISNHYYIQYIHPKMLLPWLLFILVQLLLLSFASVTEINKETFKASFGITFQEYQHSPQQQRGSHLILFYRTDAESSLDTREIFNDIAKQHQNRNKEMNGKESINENSQASNIVSTSLVFSEIDCGENKEICEYFNIHKFPSLLYAGGDRKIYKYEGEFDLQELVFLTNQCQQNSLASAPLKQHKLKSSTILAYIQTFFKNQIVMYCIVFLIGPFLFGYFAMGKKDSQSSTNKMEKLFQSQLETIEKDQKKD